MGPLNKGGIIIWNWDRTTHKEFREFQIVKNMRDMKECFTTFLSKTKLGPGRASGGIWLAFDSQWRGLKSHIRYPAMDQDLKGSKWIGAAFWSCRVTSWGPQFVSDIEDSLVGSGGKWTKEFMWESRLEVKEIPLSMVNFKHITYFAVLMWDGVINYVSGNNKVRHQHRIMYRDDVLS